VTIIAGITAGNVRRSLAGRRETVVAGTAGTQHLRMVNRHNRCEYVRRMAVLTNVRCVDVCRILAGCFCAVVATETVAADINVVEVRRQPAQRAVAIIAGVATGDMGRSFTSRNSAIVAGATGADHLRVVDGHDWYKDISRVAVFADVRRLNMGQSLTRRVGAVMATKAVAADVDVVEVRGNPAHRTVAVIAGITAANVCIVLAAGDEAIVAGTANADDLGVVDRSSGDECVARMAVLANT